MTEPTVMLVDDHEIVRRGLVEVVVEAGFNVVAEAGSVRDALVRAVAVRPQIVLVDLKLPDGTGLDVVRGLREKCPSARCIILTGFDDEQAITAAADAGALGFLLKTVQGNEIVQAIRDVAQGRNLLRGRVPSAEEQADPLSELTRAERSVVELIASGMSNREIGDALGVAEKTVKNHMTSVMAKLGFGRRTQVVAWMNRMQSGQQPEWRNGEKP